jgi:hypothetical protein
MTTPDVKQETPMAEEVKRYRELIDAPGFSSVYEFSTGRYVLASHYDAAVARVDELVQEAARQGAKASALSAELDGVCKERDLLAARVAALEAGIRNWASECAECSGKGRVLSPLNQSARNLAKPDEIVRVHQFVPCEACADIRAYLPKEPT